MRESLVLDRLRLDGGGSGKVCSLEICSRKVCDSRTNGGGEIDDRLLNLSRVVVGFGLINPCDPEKGGIGRLIKESGED